MQVLVIEDDPITGKVISRMLKILGYQVIEIVKTGNEAIDKITNLKPDVVLSDVKLSGDLSGFDVAATIQEKLNIPFVFLSGQDNLSTAVEHNIRFSFLNKRQLTVDELRKAIEKVISENK